ncbi:MAG: ABC transporter ATP-binding protein [Fibrobacterota bacterium]
MIRVDALSYGIGEFHLDATLEVGDNEYFVLLGMTGSGKTLFLENLCGLRSCQSGTVSIDGNDVTDVEPRERTIGYVPQDNALFEHLNVRRNIGFALEVKGLASAERDKEVARIAELLKITPLLDRNVRGLSGGERQRVALGRALLGRPRVLLLDEPVSALDEYTRANVCEELKKIQRDFRLPVIHVCHSFEEARLVADRVGIMHNGRIVQTGTPLELYESPAALTVANILRVDNVFQGVASETDKAGSLLRVNGLVLQAPLARGPVTFMIRSSHIDWTHGAGPTNPVHCKISDIATKGTHVRVTTQGALPLVFYLSNREAAASNFKVGLAVELAFGPEAIHYLS